MQGELQAWLEPAQASLTDELARRLHARAGGVFRAIGPDDSARVAARMVAALASDLASGEDVAAREVLLAVVEELAPRGLGYSDLRHLAQTLRRLALAALAAAPDAPPAAAERLHAWCFQLALIAAMRLVAHREAAFVEQAAQLEVRNLESQLGELQQAYAEKSRLLEQIRQASTPIAPVLDGVLVVPLVGPFDAARAQALTEKLLQAVSAARAQVVILDISGVPVFDGEAAAHILRTAQATRLLGASLILVGMAPETARTVVALGVDLTGLTTRGTLQSGLAEALARRGLTICPAR